MLELPQPARHDFDDPTKRCWYRPFAEHGFSLVESLVALLLLLVLMSAVFAIVNPSSIAAQTQPEVMDVQQRARVAMDAIERDLLNAGAGMTSGPAVGPIAQ